MTPGDVLPFRRLEVAPQRLSGWVESFADRHGAVTAQCDDTTATFRAADGASAQLEIPFPPMTTVPPGAGPDPAQAGGDTKFADPAVQLAQRIAAHVLADRTVAVLLVRLGGY